MITYRDMAFCSNKDCPHTICPRHMSQVPFDALPKYMPVALADLTGEEYVCYKQKAKEGKENENT